MASLGAELQGGARVLMDKLALMVDFPRLAPPARFEITSPRTVAYNCIAWAAGETQRKWWPDKVGVAYWPKGVPREAHPGCFCRGLRDARIPGV